jgi:peptidyl-prolyl cis-trans isomerase B (cyclophilin B)
MNRSVWRPAAAGLLALLLSACTPPAAQGNLGCGRSTVPCLQGKMRVALITSKGRVLIDLDGTAAPLTAGNVLDLVRRGAYTGTVFHRVVREPQPFVVQGGDPLSAQASVPATNWGQGSWIDPATNAPRFIPLELKRNNEGQPRYGTVIEGPRISSELALPHHRGAVAMARSQDPNSASAQFYVALADLPELDGRYAVFGTVVEGMPVIDAIRQGDRIIKAEVVGPVR